MEIILPVLACLAFGAPLGFAGSLLFSSAPNFMAGLMSDGRTELGWPRGVQEEEPAGWHWDPVAAERRLPMEELAVTDPEAFDPGWLPDLEVVKAPGSELPTIGAEEPVLEHVIARVARRSAAH